jgi:RNA polymerase sigma factor (sigma-70 family)
MGKRISGKGTGNSKTEDYLANSGADIELISGCISNDRRAQEQLYRQFYGPMTSICLRYTRNQEDAIEVLHNGFLKVYKNMHTYNASKASLYTWIRTIIVNSAIDFIRQRGKFKNNIELERAEEPAIEADAIQRMSAHELLLLVQQLTPATQTVFNLYVVEGYNHREIANLLGISEGTSKWHLSEARKQLQKLLQTLQV